MLWSIYRNIPFWILICRHVYSWCINIILKKDRVDLECSTLSLSICICIVRHRHIVTYPSFCCLVSNILLQTPQTFLGSLKHIIILADREAEIIFGNFRVVISVEFCGRNSSNANLMNEEPAELEVPRTTGNMRRERIVLGKFDSGHIDKNKVSALRIRVL